MRLLHVSLRSLLLYALLLVVISIPVSLYSIQQILNEEVDETLSLHADQFLTHIKRFEDLEDLETDLHVLDQLSYDIHVKPAPELNTSKEFETLIVYDSVEREQRPFRQLSSGIIIKGKPYRLSITLSLVDNQDLIFAIGMVQAVLIILLTAGLVLINRSLSKRLWKPFYRTLNQLKAYQLDKNQSLEIEKTNIIEFDDLNKTVGSLMDRNRAVFLQQREFIENASHELQTPLAIFQSKLDVLMQQPALSESYAETISELEATAQRMSRLNKSLLLLSKIENEQFTDMESVDFDSLIREHLKNIAGAAEAKEIHIVTGLSPLRFMANKTLVEVLITNLLHNAVRHTSDGGTIRITTVNHTLSIFNTGEQLSMDADKIFDRFSKETQNTSSTGLGLAIVKKICDLSRYQLQYSYENGNHKFSVTFSPLQN